MGNLEKSVVVSGTGKTREEAFSKALASIQKVLGKEVEGTIIRIEPVAVRFLEGLETVSTERFMFFFLKRDVSTFFIKLEVDVNLFVVDVAGFPIETKRKNGLLDKFVHRSSPS